MTDRSWLEGWARIRACFPDQARSETDEGIRSQSYRKYLDCLTEHQWEHAVGESLRLEKFFPTVSTLLEYGEHAPAKLLDWTGDCPLCEGTGFEPFERKGYMYVRHCPRGCIIGAGAGARDYRTDEEKKADAKAGVEAIKAAVAAKEAEVEAKAAKAKSQHAAVRRGVLQAGPGDRVL